MHTIQMQHAHAGMQAGLRELTVLLGVIAGLGHTDAHACIRMKAGGLTVLLAVIAGRGHADTGAGAAAGRAVSAHRA